jgi:probable HAF family extracellular repeat protein
MQAARNTVLVVIFSVVIGQGAIAAPIYTLRDLGTVSFADIGDQANERIYITNTGQIGYGRAPSQGPYTIGVDYSNSDTSGSIGYVTPVGGSRITIAPPSGWPSGYAYTTAMPEGVNASGEVVGYGYGSSLSRAVIFQVGGDQNGTATFLPQLTQLYSPNGTNGAGNDLYVNVSAAFGINAAGQIVGEAGNEALLHAFVYSNGISTDLNSLISPGSGLTLNSAVSINDLGEIVGYATDSSGNIHDYLLVPLSTPEPGTFQSLSVGILLLTAGKFFVRNGRKDRDEKRGRR